MKSQEQMSKELNDNTLTNGINAPEFNEVVSFYEKYLQYQELNAASVAILLRIKSRGRKVRVHEFENGSIWFVGPFSSDKDVPLASIGDWQCKTSWEADLKNCSKLIEEL